jgi:hypothetical protein
MKELSKDEALDALNTGKIIWIQISKLPAVCIKVHRSSFKHDTLVQTNKDVIDNIFANSHKIFVDEKKGN